MNISDFILARVAEEEDAAHAALDGRAPEERWRGRSTGQDAPDAGTDAEHAQRWNPWRVQSACLVRRLIVQAHRNTGPAVTTLADGSSYLTGSTCQTCRNHDGEPARWPCYTIRVLASEWSDHPEYRKEWQPFRSNAGRSR